MMIKVGDEYLDFDGDIQMQRQIINYETVETVGDFSYSFEVQPTANNKRLLRLESIDSESSPYESPTVPCQIQNNDGVTLHYGDILVTDTFLIQCSFISGNNAFFKLINGNVRDIDLSQYDVIMTEDAIESSWSANEGVVFPLVDRGGLTFRKDPFLVLRRSTNLVRTSDFQPFIYVKNAFRKVFADAGIKITGDLLDDGTFNALITTNNDDDYVQSRIEERKVRVRKTIPQTITDAGYTKVTFDDDTSLGYYNNDFMPFDLSNSRWVGDLQGRINIKSKFILSDGSKNVIFEWFSLPVASGNLRVVRGTTVNIAVNDFESLGGASGLLTFPGNYVELYAKVDPATPGSVDIIEGDWEGTVLSIDNVYASGLLPNQTKRDFINDIFRMFNVICSYDFFSKTLNISLFNKLITRPEQDLSQYVSSYQKQSGFEVVSDFSKRNVINYSQDDSPEVEDYNKANEYQYGSGYIDINNRFLNDESELFSVEYTAPFSQYYSAYGLQLLRLNYIEYYVDDSVIDITSVTDNGSGLAKFNGGSLSGGPPVYHNNNYIDDAQGKIDYLLNNREINNTSQIIAIHVINVSLPISIKFTQDNVPLGIDYGVPNRAYEFTNPTYNGDWLRVEFSPEARTEASVAVFSKYEDGTDLDVFKQGLSFGNIKNHTTLNLVDTYYSLNKKFLNTAVKIEAQLVVPENIYKKLDFLRPVRLITKDFNSLFYINKDVGYIDSANEFVIELIKIY